MQNNVEVSKSVEFIGHHQPVYTLLAARIPGRFFSAGGDKFIVEWDISNPAQGELIATLPYTIYSMCLHPYQDILIAGTSEGGIHFIDLVTKKELKYFRLPGEGVFDIQFNAIHNIIHCATSKGNILMVDGDHFEIIKTINLSSEKIRSMVPDLTGNIYAACSDGHIYHVEIPSGRLIHQWEAHAWATNCVWIGPHQKMLISGSKDAHLRGWELSDYSLQKNIPAHNYAIYKIAGNSTGELIATASRDKTVKLWDKDLHILKRINKEKDQGHTHSVNALLWLSSHTLVSAGDDRKIMTWEIKMI